jgi:hypothetical protein
MAKMRISKAKNNDDLLGEDNSQLLGNQYAHQHYAKRKAAADARQFVAHYERNHGPLGPGLNAEPMVGTMPTNQSYTKPTRSNPNPVPMTGQPASSRITAQPKSPNEDLLGGIVDRPQIVTGVQEHLGKLQREARGLGVRQRENSLTPAQVEAQSKRWRNPR